MRHVPFFTIKLRCYIRHYTYVAYLSKATGRLIKIKAGCRTWYGFVSANEHYQNPKFNWSDDTLGSQFGCTFAQRFGWRAEARGILSQLEREVRKAQERIKRRKALARKKARATR